MDKAAATIPRRTIKIVVFGAVHILRNAERGRGGQLKRYQCIFRLYKSIRILTKSVTLGEGVKNGLC